MDMAIFILVLSALPQFVVSEVVPAGTSFRATVEVVPEVSRIFSGESIRLRCSIPDDHRSVWNYLWFRGSEQLPQTGSQFSLWNAKVKESGKFSCQGVRDTLVGNIHSLRSLPVEINVDGGWAILHAPPHPGFVGENVTVTCHLRHNLPVHETILYKDGIEVMRQSGLKSYFHLNNLSLEDEGMYSCRASWDMKGRTYSVISAATYVQILEVLSQPVLEISTHLIQDKMKLTCHVQYNAHAPAPPIHFYFYKNNIRIGTATSQNHDVVRRIPGQYSCKAKVPELGLLKWSEPKSFGQVTGPQAMALPHLHPNSQRPLAPVALPTKWSYPPATQPTSVPLSNTAPTFIQHTKEPGILVSTSKYVNPTATPLHIDISRKHGDTSGEPSDMPKESGDKPEDFGDMSEESGDMPKDFGDDSEESGDMPEESSGMPEASVNMSV